MYDDEPKPARNEELIKLYNFLRSLAASLPPTISSLSLRDDSGTKFNSYIDELINIIHDGRLNDFKVKQYHVNSRTHTSGEEYSRQLMGLLRYLHEVDRVIGYYCSGPPPLKFADGTQPTITNQMNALQNASQSTNVEIEIRQTILQLNEQLTEVERLYPDEASKENQFAKKLKGLLPTLNGSLDLVGKVIKIALDLGLSPQVVLKLLGIG